MHWWDDEGHRAWLALTWICALAVCAPLLHRFPPSSDFPEHAATVATLVDLQNGGPLASWYTADFLHTQYWLATAVASQLSPLAGGPAEALRLLLAIALAGQLLALRWLLGALGADRRLTLLAGVMVWSRPLVLGFIPFLLGIPLVLLAFGLVARPGAARWHNQALLATVALGCFYLNLSNVLWLGVGACAVAWAAHGRKPAEKARGFGFRRVFGSLALRSMAGALWGLGVLVIPLGQWLVTSTVMHPDPAAFRKDFLPRFHAPWRVLGEAPGWLTDLWPGHAGLVLLVVWGLLVLALLLPLLLPIEPAKEHRNLTLPRALVLATALLWLAVPFEQGWLWGLNQRFAPFLMMLLPAAFTQREGWPRRLVPLLGAALTLGSSALAERQTARFQAEMADLETVLTGLPGARLLQLTFEHGSDVAVDSVSLHANGYHRVWNHGPTEPSFVEMPQSVLHYLPERGPWLRPWPWEFLPEQYDNAREGPQYDVILVRGESPSFPPPSEASGPRWKALRHAGRWTLYDR